MNPFLIPMTVVLPLLVVSRGFCEDAQAKPCKVFAVTGEFAGKEVDLLAERKEKPTVYLFVSAENWDRPIGRYLKALDEQLAKGIDGAPDAAAVAIWLTNDVPKSKEYLPIAQRSLQFSKTDLAVFDGQLQGPMAGMWTSRRTSRPLSSAMAKKSLGSSTNRPTTPTCPRW